MLKVGLTGGIGSGKTTVSDQFRALGVPVIDTDVIAHELVKPGSSALDTIAKTFGPDILTSSGELDRERLGRIVFSDVEMKRRLEDILHPEIRKETLRRLKALVAPYCIVVVPLLIETDFIRLVDKVLVVDARDSARIHRVRMRNGRPANDIENIIKAQTCRKARRKTADYLIDNNGTLEELNVKVAKLHHRILTDCGNRLEP